MAKLTWTVETAAGTVAEDGPIISEANMTRFVDFLWYYYTPLDAQDNPLPRNSANEAQAFRKWARRQWRITKEDVFRYERMVTNLPDIET